MNISPVDGRYRHLTEPLQAYFSEEALIRYRVHVEIAYFLALCQIPLPVLSTLTSDQLEQVKTIPARFSTDDARRVKAIESSTRHDIKAVEYYIKERFDQLGLSASREMVHFGLTSQDINNTAVPLSLKEAMQDTVYPLFDQLATLLEELSERWQGVIMLAHTHGQPASPTSMGKEIKVFHERLTIQLTHLRQLPYPAKFGGASGNFNAHQVTYPHIDWVAFANSFCESLGLKRSQTTTQIDHYDGLAAIFDTLKRLCTILIDLVRDGWMYISMDYFKQQVVEGEVGSSAMPHKVNPIDFENAEGNAGMAIAILEHLSAKLPVSRLQRDLSDSTVLRNVGVPLAHLLIALKATIKGLRKLEINREVIHHDLEQNTAVVAEAIQSILRSISYPQPYEALKSLTRTGSRLDMEELHRFIDGLEVDEDLRKRMKAITPFNYTGIIRKNR